MPEKLKKPQLIFPTNLSRVGYTTSSGSKNEIPNIPYIELTAWKWHVNTNAKKNASMFVLRTRRGTVVLPLALNINDVQGINWETQEGLGAKNLAQLGIKTGLDFLRGLSSTIAKFIEAKKGATSNDLQSLAFGLTNFREWQFTFKLMPKSEADSQRLAEIIQFFKQQSITEFSGNIIDYPSFFVIKVHFPSGDNGKLFEKLLVFKTAVITNLAVQYLPDGQSFYRDGAPTAVALDITFKELERTNKSEYNLDLG
jgi:hypothetical protein